MTVVVLVMFTIVVLVLVTFFVTLVVMFVTIVVFVTLTVVLVVTVLLITVVEFTLIVALEVVFVNGIVLVATIAPLISSYTYVQFVAAVKALSIPFKLLLEEVIVTVLEVLLAVVLLTVVVLVIFMLLVVVAVPVETPNDVPLLDRMEVVAEFPEVVGRPVLLDNTVAVGVVVVGLLVSVGSAKLPIFVLLAKVRSRPRVKIFAIFCVIIFYILRLRQGFANYIETKVRESLDKYSYN